MGKSVIAIIGRPNVGKSTLFNRIAGRRMAIVEDTPGVTRDRNYAHVSYFGKEFTLVDTGGFEPDSSDLILTQMRHQAQIAIDEADIIIFLMDGKEGSTSSDLDIIERLRKVKKPVYYVLNKIDTKKSEENVSEFYKFGIDKFYPISAEHGRCVDELLDDICLSIPSALPEENAAEYPKIAVVGKPNAGKSTLINRMLGKDRLVTSPVPGTTRDSIDTIVTYYQKEYMFVDTAGIRKKARVHEGVEYYSVVRSLRSIERCDIAIILVDAVEGLTDQDLKIIRYIEEAEKGCIIAINKWDIVEKDQNTMEQYTKNIKKIHPHLDHIPLLFLSALTGNRVQKVYDEINRIMEEYERHITTGELNRFIGSLADRLPVSTYRGKPLKLYYATQAGVRPPEFVMFVNHPDAMSTNVIRFLENNIREKWGFLGVPLRIVVRKRMSNR